MEAGRCVSKKNLFLLDLNVSLCAVGGTSQMWLKCPQMRSIVFVSRSTKEEETEMFWHQQMSNTFRKPFFFNTVTLSQFQCMLTFPKQWCRHGNRLGWVKYFRMINLVLPTCSTMRSHGNVIDIPIAASRIWFGAAMNRLMLFWDFC